MMFENMDYIAFETINNDYIEFWEMNEDNFTFDESTTLDDCEYYE